MNYVTKLRLALLIGVASLFMQGICAISVEIDEEIENALKEKFEEISTGLISKKNLAFQALLQISTILSNKYIKSETCRFIEQQNASVKDTYPKFAELILISDFNDTFKNIIHTTFINLYNYGITKEIDIFEELQKIKPLDFLQQMLLDTLTIVFILNRRINTKDIDQFFQDLNNFKTTNPLISKEKKRAFFLNAVECFSNITKNFPGELIHEKSDNTRLKNSLKQWLDEYWNDHQDEEDDEEYKDVENANSTFSNSTKAVAGLGLFILGGATVIGIKKQSNQEISVHKSLKKFRQTLWDYKYAIGIGTAMAVAYLGMRNT